MGSTPVLSNSSSDNSGFVWNSVLRNTTKVFFVLVNVSCQREKAGIAKRNMSSELKRMSNDPNISF